MHFGALLFAARCYPMLEAAASHHHVPLHLILAGINAYTEKVN